MKLRYIFKSLLIAVLVAVSATGCDYDEELVEELQVSREFAPVALTARVRNQVNVELNWTVDENVSNYVVEFSANDPEFNNIVKTVEVSPEELPVLIPLDGETVYYIRVKAQSARGREDSSWATAMAETLTEQIFIEGEPGDVLAKEVTLRWAPGSEVTEIRFSPGDITHTITAEEKSSGIATVTGLDPETNYTATLYNGERIRGVQEFTTGIDIGAGILVTTEDDLFQMIADAEPGAILVLEPGDYTGQTGAITLDKSITIRGLRSFDKPLLNVNFEVAAGATDVALVDLEIQGGDGEAPPTLSNFLEFTEAGNYNSLLISGCYIHDYETTFIKGDENGAVLQNLTVENSIVYDILTNGGDFIDFRSGDVLNIVLRTSTFYNVAPSRDFIRLDASGASNDAGITANILIDSCTFYAVADDDSRRLLYVRFVSNDVTVRNTLIANTASEGYADRSGIDESPTFSNNNYFNAPGFHDSSQYIFDNTDFTTLDPGFVDPESGDFTITNQTLIDERVGDPRWR